MSRQKLYGHHGGDPSPLLLLRYECRKRAGSDFPLPCLERGRASISPPSRFQRIVISLARGPPNGDDAQSLAANRRRTQGLPLRRHPMCQLTRG